MRWVLAVCSRSAQAAKTKNHPATTWTPYRVLCLIIVIMIMVHGRAVYVCTGNRRKLQL